MLVSVFCMFFLLILDGLFFQEGSRASTVRQCAEYTISFDPSVKDVPTGVYLDTNLVGEVVRSDLDEKRQGEVSVCIDKRFSRHVERGTVFYISKGRLQMYNVWATGERLKEGETLAGFSSKFKLYLHELKVLGMSLVGIFRMQEGT
ncbi:MAG: hypothetical protein ACLGSA_09560 [Acidobacteriota bacterium]